MTDEAISRMARSVHESFCAKRKRKSEGRRLGNALRSKSRGKKIKVSEYVSQLRSCFKNVGGTMRTEQVALVMKGIGIAGDDRRGRLLFRDALYSVASRKDGIW